MAENQGKVVSHDELLDHAWQSTIVSPNTLQKNIAELRKALGDDRKANIIIKTHAKQGYSLESEVYWFDTAPLTCSEQQQNDLDVVPSIAQNNEPGRIIINYKSQYLFVFIIVFSLLGGLFYHLFLPSESESIRFNDIALLTSTDDREGGAVYSPDGQHIVYWRALDTLCIKRLWARSVMTQQETQLTRNWGTFGDHNFSPDGHKLAFIGAECNATTHQRSRFNRLLTMDFNESLNQPQTPNLLLEFARSQIREPIWLSNDEIALLQKSSNRWKLIRYSLSDNTSHDLFVLADGNILDFSYSIKDEIIALVTIHHDGKHYLDMLRKDGELLSSHPIQRPSYIPKHHQIYPSFSPVSGKLIFSTGRQLFTLSYSGEVEKISLPFSEVMFRPEFHPNGQSMLMIQGLYDSDIVQVSKHQLQQLANSDAKTTQNYASIERSNKEEEFGVLQPGGELIAFASARSGNSQLYVSSEDSRSQLSDFVADSFIRGIIWAEDGNSLLVNVNRELHQIYLNKQQKVHLLPYPVVQLFHWDSHNNSALLQLRVSGVLSLVEYNLDNSTFQVLSDEQIKWASKSADGHVIYKDDDNHFWKLGPADPESIDELTELHDASRSFLMDGNIMYGLNANNQVWSYSLNTQKLSILGNINENILALTDVRNDKFLMTSLITAKKDVVELAIAQ